MARLCPTSSQSPLRAEAPHDRAPSVRNTLKAADFSEWHIQRIEQSQAASCLAFDEGHCARMCQVNRLQDSNIMLREKTSNSLGVSIASFQLLPVCLRCILWIASLASRFISFSTRQQEAINRWLASLAELRHILRSGKAACRS